MTPKQKQNDYQKRINKVKPKIDGLNQFLIKNNLQFKAVLISSPDTIKAEIRIVDTKNYGDEAKPDKES